MSERRRAEKLYGQFREAKPQRVRHLKVTWPKALMVMGHCEFVGYATTHKGKVSLYIHEFAQGSRPLLCAAPGKSQLFLLGGRFDVTARGITDRDRSGRIVHAPRRYDVKPKT